MVLVDSSVWINYLSVQTSKVERKLEALIRPNNQAVITGIIFQEILQGIRNPRSLELTQKLLGRFPFLVPDSDTHLKAAQIFRSLVSHRVMVTSIDALLAALAIHHRIPLFTLDTGFRLIGAHSDLELFE